MFGWASAKFAELQQTLTGRSGAVHSCESPTAVIFVAVGDAGTGGALDGVTIQLAGPAEASKATGTDGGVNFDAVKPGTYDIGASFPSPKYKDYRVMPYDTAVSAVGGHVTIVEIQAYQVGTLVVKVVRSDNTATLVDKTGIWTTSAPQPFNVPETNGTKTFADALTGEYRIAAFVPDDLYEQPVSPAATVTVTGGASVTAEIQVHPRTWVKVRVYDEAAKADVGNAYVTVDQTDGKKDVRRQTADGVPAEFKMVKKPDGGTANVTSVSTDDYYEVVSVDDEG